MAASTTAASSAAASGTPPLPGGAATAASSSSSSGSGGLAALTRSGMTRARQVSADIDELLQAQKRAREEKRRLASELKNARRRRNRLTKRARQLSTEDLLTVVALREAEGKRRCGDPAPAGLGDAVMDDLVGGAAEDKDRLVGATADAQDATETEE